MTKKSRISFATKPRTTFFIWLLLLLSIPTNTNGQQTHFLQHADTLNKTRLQAVTIGTTTLYAGTMTGLYYMWYRDFPLSSFHFKNDNHHWMMLDKMGHATTAYQVGLYGHQLLSWTGLHENASIWIGGSLGLFFLTSVEVLDGLSTEWGFSPGDFFANAFGSALFISQQLAWQEQRMSIKISFTRSKYAQYRPNLLGNNLVEEIIKDYNGQTFWLSVNPKSFLPENSRFPGWLNIALGYGGDGMTGAHTNPTIVNGIEIPQFNRTRQFYLSPDIDLKRLPIKNKSLRTLLSAINFIKVPLPALEYNKEDGFRLHGIFF